jgi:EmrB/QacA subfamily drug resistance transporter
MEDHTRNRVLLVLFIGVLMGALDIAIIGPALPSIQRDFGLNDRTLGWTIAIYVLFNLIGTPLMAKLSDLKGRRPVYVWAVSIFALGSLLVAVCPNFAVLLIGRSVQGFGSGGIFPVAVTIIGETFPAHRRGRTLGLLGAVFGLAFLIGPILGGILLMISWRLLFIVNLPIALLIITMSLRHLPAGTRSQRRSFDLVGMALLAGLLISLAYGLQQLDTAHLGSSLTSARVGPFLLGAGVLLPVFWRIETNTADPIFPVRLFRSRQTVLVCVFSVGSGLFQGALVFVPAFLVAAYGVTSARASFMLVPLVVVLGLSAPVAGWLLDQLGSKRVLMGGACLTTAGMGCFALFGTDLVYFYIASATIALGLSSLVGAPLRYIVLNETPQQDRTAAQGAINVMTQVGLLVSGVMVAAIADSQGGGADGYRAAYLFLAVIALGLTCLAFGLKNRKEELETLKEVENIP